MSTEKEKTEPPLPDPETDERLRTPRLPDPPQFQFERPQPKEQAGSGYLARRGLAASDASDMGRAYGVGTALMSSILGGAFLGWLVDRFLIKAATPYGLIVGVLLGVVSGFTQMLRIAASLDKKKGE